jgi:hypothetical protein
LWTAETIQNGYGRYRLKTVGGVQGRKVQAHRYAWESLVGSIPEGFVLDHLCRVRACVNPDHLEPVTNLENVLRGANGRMVRCRKGGHPMDGVRGDGVYCKQCHRDRDAAYRARKRATSTEL